MTRRLACALLVLWSASALAQEAPRPDFSGTWKLDKDKSTLQAPAPDTSILYIDHSGPRFLLTRAHVVDGEADLFHILVLTDGKDDVKKSQDHRTVNRCHWEGDKLILESRQRTGRKESLTVMKHSLSPDGKTLTVEERFTGPDKKYANALVLQRETTPPTLDVTDTDLAQIKAAGLWYYVTKQPHGWQPFTVELGRGAYFPAREGRGPRIGIFELQQAGGRLALVRQPPIGAVMAYFGFYLAKLEGKWVVLDDYFMEEWMAFEEE
jgi:hypothetical protein